MNSAGFLHRRRLATSISSPPARLRPVTTCPIWWMSASQIPSSPVAQEHLPPRSRLWRHRQDGARQFVVINDQAGKPAKTVIIVHEDSLFGSGLAKLLNAQLPAKGFESWRRSRIRRRRAISPTSCSRSRRRIPTSSFPPTTTTNTSFLPAPCRNSMCGRKASIRCSAARRPRTSSSRSFRTPPIHHGLQSRFDPTAPKRWS